MAGEGINKGRNLYYRCTDRIYSFPLPPNCKAGPINARIADELVWAKLTGLIQSPALLMREIVHWKERRKAATHESGEDIKNLELEMGKLKKESDRYLRAYGGNVISMEQLKEYMDSVKSRMEPLKKHIADIRSKESQPEEIVVPATEAEIAQLVGKTKNVLSRLNFLQKRAIVTRIVNKVLLNGGVLHVTGRLSSDFPSCVASVVSAPGKNGEI